MSIHSTTWLNRRFAAATQIARERAPCANRKSVRAWSALARDSRAAAAAKRGFNRVVAQRFRNAAQRRG
eukprot:10326794-Lingulodinium_polyedra.AAC.1